MAGSSMNFLPYLDRACCGSRRFVLIEVQTRVLEIQTESLEEFSCLAFLALCMAIFFMF